MICARLGPMRARRLLVLVGLALSANALVACRSCAHPPQPAARENAHREGAEPVLPVAAPSTLAPTPDVPVAAAPSAPTPSANAPPTSNFDALEHGLITSTRTLDQLIGPTEVPQPVRRAAEGYIECTAVTAPDACRRLSGEPGSDCSITVGQLDARRRGATGWFITPAVIAVCASGGVSEAVCRQYGAAIEAHDAAQCPTQLGAGSDCAAVASGDSSRCSASGERGCTDRVRWYDAVREGPDRVAAANNSRYAPFIAGARGVDRCAALLAPLHAPPPTPTAMEPAPATMPAR